MLTVEYCHKQKFIVAYFHKRHSTGELRDKNYIDDCGNMLKRGKDPEFKTEDLQPIATLDTADLTEAYRVSQNAAGTSPNWVDRRCTIITHAKPGDCPRSTSVCDVLAIVDPEQLSATKFYAIAPTGLFVELKSIPAIWDVQIRMQSPKPDLLGRYIAQVWINQLYYSQAYDYSLEGAIKQATAITLRLTGEPSSSTPD